MKQAGQSDYVAASPGYRRRFDLLAWALALAVGFGALLAYQMKAGVPAALPEKWPAEAGLPFDARRSNLVMFAHPQCPCSGASLEELKIILTRGRGALAATVCFFHPPGAPADWTETSLTRAAREIPGVNVVLDRRGSITEKFGAMTSGQVVLFDALGRRLFAGGITGSRGHAGENRGRLMVLALAKGEVCAPDTTPVFGCALHEPAEREDVR